MKGVKSLEFLVLCYLINGVAGAYLWDFSKHVSVTRNTKNKTSVFSKRSTVFSPQQPLLLTDPLQSITVHCFEAKMVIVVQKDLFGTGHLIQESNIQLGPKACHHAPTLVSSSLMTFEIGLQECGSNLQTTPDSLDYRTNLYYNSDPTSKPRSIKKIPVEIPIECHYPRKDNVSSNIKQTRAASVTSASEESLYFSLHLMTEDWGAERKSNQYWLGDSLQIQAEVYRKDDLPLRLFVDDCIATLTPDRKSIPRYTIIDSHGCLVSGRAHGLASAFRVPRSQPQTLQFTTKSFRFAEDTVSLIYIICHLKATAADNEPDVLNKACSFNSQKNTWLPLEGAAGICNCCEVENCELPKANITINHRAQRHGRKIPLESAVINISEGETGTDLMVGPVLILDAHSDFQGDEAEKTVPEGESPVIENEADSAVDDQFILKADEGLRWLLHSDKTLNDSVSYIATEDGVAATQSSNASGNSTRQIASMEVAKLPLKGSAPVKVTLEQLQTTLAGILGPILFKYIF